MEIKTLDRIGTKIALDTADIHTFAVVLFLPGVSGGAFTERYDTLSKACRKGGMDFLRVQSWHTHKELEERNTRLLHQSIDTAVSYIKEKGYTNIRAVGKSMGGTMLLTRNHPDVSRMVLWAPVVGIAETAGNLDDKLDTAFSEVHSLNEITLDEKTLMQIKTPVRIIQGSEDEIMPLASARKLVGLLPSADLIEIEKMGHSPDTPEQQEKVTGATVQFLEQI